MAPARKEGRSGASKAHQASPTAASTLMYMVNHMSRSNALVVSQAAIAKGIGAKREREPRCPLPGRTQLHPGHQSRWRVGLRGEQPGHVARQSRGNAMQPSALTSWPSKASKIRRPSSRPRRSSASLDWLKANGCWWAMNRSTHPIRASSNCRDGGPPVQARRCPAGGGRQSRPGAGGNLLGEPSVDPRKPGAKRQAGG